MSSPQNQNNDPLALIETEEDEAELRELVPDGVSLEDVLRDVQDALASVPWLSIDIQDPSDVDQVRTALPTEPTRARFVAAALPPVVANALEYVEPSDRQAGYWRRSRERSDPGALSDDELRYRLRFMQTAKDVRGTEGVEYQDGNVMSKATLEMGRELEDSGPRTDESGDNTNGLLRRILERL